MSISPCAVFDVWITFPLVDAKSLVSVLLSGLPDVLVFGLFCLFAIILINCSSLRARCDREFII